MSIFESFYRTEVQPPRPSAMPDLPMKAPGQVKVKPLRKKTRKAKPEPGFFSRLSKVVTGKANLKKTRKPAQSGLVLKKRKRRAKRT